MNSALLLTQRGVTVVSVVGVTLIAIVLLILVLALRRGLRPAEPSSFEQALCGSHERSPARVQQLAKLEREVALGIANSFDLHHRLGPTLRETAAGLLAARHGVELDAQPERARELLGVDGWEIVRADRPAPLDRTARGIDVDVLDSTITALEAL